jgi:hypothetical protein
MRGRGFVVLLLALALPLVAVVAAQADRKPTAKERRLVADVVDLPPQCAKVRISTVTKKPTWASVTFKPGPAECDPLASDGVTVAKKKSNGHWRFVTAGSSFGCDELFQDVPQKVALDLNIDCF